MESSRALARCLEQLQFHHNSCLRTSRAAATRRLSSRTQLRNRLPSSARAFTTTLTTQRDAPDPSIVPSQSNAPAAAQTDAPPQPRRSSIDLSSITTSPNYKKPTSPSPAVHRSTLDALDKLVAGERAKQREKDEAFQQRISNYDIWGERGAKSSKSGTGSIYDRKTPVRTPVPREPFDPRSLVDRARSPSDIGALSADLKVPEITLRLKPTLGRTVDVNEGTNTDLTKAFVFLEAKINNRGNSVRKDERDQKFHVRRGQKRKIKKRERWRVLFRDGFLGECERVRKMIRQGW